MKALFCVDKTADSCNKTIDGTELIIAQLSPKEVKRQHFKTFRGIVSSVIPNPLAWLFFLSLSASAFALIVFFFGMDTFRPLSELLSDYPGFFIFAGVSFLCTVSCIVFMRNPSSFFELLTVLISGAALLTLLLLYGRRIDRTLSFGEQLSCIPLILKLALAAYVCLILWQYFKNGLPPLREWLFLTQSLGLLLILLLIFSSADRHEAFLLRLSRSPGAFIAAAVCLLIPIACLLCEPCIRRAPGDTSPAEEEHKAEDEDEELRRVLSLPPDEDIDVLTVLRCNYVRYGDELHSGKSGRQLMEKHKVVIYADEDSVSLVDMYLFIRIYLPKSCMTGFSAIYKDVLHSATVPVSRAINKSETPPLPKYPKVDYYALELRCGDEDYALYFPPEELSHMQELTGIKTESKEIPFKV